MTATKTDPKKLAYSYIRCSSPEQLKGNSIERQLERAAEYAKKHGLTLSPHGYHDLGVSAFRSKNRSEGGELYALIEAIKAKRIPPESTLIIENLDRLSRDFITESLPLFMSILKAGVNIVTLSDQRVWSHENVKRNSTDLLYSIMILARSHDESARKSDLALHNWRKARENADKTKIPQSYPAWLELKKNEFKVIPAKAKVIRSIFQMYLDGHGTGAVARWLNDKGIPTFQGKKWQQTTVKYYLKYRGVVGEYHAGRRENGKKVKTDLIVADYYPRIVSETDFARAQARLRQNKKTQGRPQPEEANLFAGIIRCGYCGGSMGIYNAANTTTHSFVCWNAVSGGCVRVAFPAREIEHLVINALDDVRGEWASREADSSKVAELEGELASLEDKLKRLVAIVESGEEVAPFIERVKQLNSLKAEISAELDIQRSYLQAGLSKRPAWSGGNSPEERLSIMPYLRRHIECVRVFAAGTPTNAARYRQRLKEFAAKGISGSKCYHIIRQELNVEWKRYFTVELKADFTLDGKTGKVLYFQKMGLVEVANDSKKELTQ